MNHRPSHHRRCCALGFTLVELVVAIMLLGILVGVAAPRFVDVASDSEAVAILTNVNLIFDAAQRFEAEHGRLPDNSAQGAAPTDLVPEYLPESLFTSNTSAGRPLDWDGPGTGADQYGVQIQFHDRARASDTDLYRRLENLADDGAVDSGWIRESGNRIIFRLADK